MSNKFSIDDRVILTSKDLLPTTEWPVWGSEYSCIGTIVDIVGDYVAGEMAWVMWDNHKTITKLIRAANLSHFHDGDEKSSLPVEPNLAFLLRKKE